MSVKGAGAVAGPFTRYISDRTIPLIGGGDSASGSNRLPFFVNPRDPSSTDIGGNDSHDGLSVETAFKTLQKAIDKCVDDVGDRIIVLRGTHSLTTPVLFNKRWITVQAADIGANDWDRGERFMLYGPADGPAAIITQPCKIRGMGFAGQNVADGSHNLRIDATGGGFFGGWLSIKHCRFATWGAVPDYLLLCKGLTNGDISDNVFDAFDAGLTVGAIGIGVSDVGAVQVSNTRFENNRFRGIGANSYAFVHLAGVSPQNNVYKANVLSGNATDLDGPKGHGKFLDNNGCTNYDTFLCDNWIGLATNTGSYDDTVATLQGLGIRFAGNHYSE